MDTPKDLTYSPHHIWVRVEGNRATMGITDYAQMIWGMIVYVELPELHSMIQAKEVFGSLENVQGMEDLISPLSGKIVAVHTELEKDPSDVHRLPYHQGWMIVIELSHPHEANQLWDAARYDQHIGE
jgi:glycine cleavage system H protein